MNREEERLEQAKFYNDKGIKDPHIHFLRGTEWADHTMIEKACEWLENDFEELTRLHLDNTVIDKFRKAMKG
jgi:hypothetical protein